MPRCTDFRDTGEVISKVGFKMFLNTTPTVIHHNRSSMPADASGSNPTGVSQNQQPQQEFSLILEENPLSEFVEMPPDAREGGLWWSNVLAGVIRGALEMVSGSDAPGVTTLLTTNFAALARFQVQLQTTAYFVSDVLRGDEQTELRVRLVKFMEEEAPPADD
jgi:hypothetical protein